MQNLMQYIPCVYVCISKCTEYCWKDKEFGKSLSLRGETMEQVGRWFIFHWALCACFFSFLPCTALPIQESITSFLPLAKLYLVRPWTLCRSRAFCSWSLSVFLPFRPGSRYGESSPNLHFYLLPRSQGSWTIINIPAVWFLMPSVVLQSRASLNCPHFRHHTLSYLVISYPIALEVNKKERKWRRSL